MRGREQRKLEDGIRVMSDAMSSDAKEISDFKDGNNDQGVSVGQTRGPGSKRRRINITHEQQFDE